MGVGVSGWRLARAVASAGQLGVVSGVALDTLLARRLSLGDPGGELRRALAAFPEPQVAQRVIGRHYRPAGPATGVTYRPTSRLALRPRRDAEELAVVANFVEVWLAKEGHDGQVGVNYLEKVQMATPSSLYGAMLAGVDVVLMGAGLPSEIPRLRADLAAHRPTTLPVAVDGAAAHERHVIAFDPAGLAGPDPAPLTPPRLFAIVASASLVTFLARNKATRPDGFVLETPVAGGHSARPRGPLRLTDDGEPVYGPRDELDLAKVRAVGLPFWLAGGYATAEALAQARAAGAAGIQVGTAFALSAESGMRPELRRQLIDQALAGTLPVRNSAAASPTGFPFKVVDLPGTAADEATFAARPRLCDLGYLRTVYAREGGGVGYRCPAEPVDEHVRKGGRESEAADRRCLCNGLVATIGLPQTRADGYVEPPLLTLGQDLGFLATLTGRAGREYSAADVIAHLLDRADVTTG
ncbi:nitronate monooxygenase [Pilimelia columellifera]